MTHVIEPALSGRAKCRGCERPIAKGEPRLGEREPNPFGDGEMTIWFHVLCSAFKRPEVLLEVLETPEAELAQLTDPDGLKSIAELGIAHERLPRVSSAQRSPSGRARCQSCRELIEKETWRIPLAYFEMGRFQSSGNIHAKCAQEYLGTVDLIDRVRHFNPDLDQDDLDEFKHAMTSAT